jgi:hypothetical protein
VLGLGHHDDPRRVRQLDQACVEHAGEGLKVLLADNFEALEETFVERRRKDESASEVLQGGERGAPNQTL